MIRVVISDFGGVLTNPLHEAFMEYEKQSGIPLSVLGEAMAGIGREHGGNPLFQLETGELTEAQFTELMDVELKARLGEHMEFASFPDLYFEHLQANEPFIECLRSAKARGFRLALLTNNVREWEHRWRAFLPIDELFETVVDSGFVGVRKPDRRIYEIMLEYLRELPGLEAVEPAECVLVDDLLHNCEAAVEFGFQAVRFEHNQQAIKDLDRLLLPA